MHGVDGFILSGSRVDDPRVQFLGMGCYQRQPM